MALRMNDAAGWTGSVDSSTGAAANIIGSMPSVLVIARDEDVFVRFGGITLAASAVVTTSTAHDRLVSPQMGAVVLELPQGATKWAAKSRSGTATMTIQPCQEV